MKKSFLKKAALILTISILLISSCKKEKGNKQSDTKAPEVIVNNNGAALDNRLSYSNADVNIQKLGVGSTEDLSQYNLQLIAEVAAPTYKGVSLQATHIEMDGNRIYISYNTRGDVYLGGVDVFDISNEACPVLISQAILPNTDVSSIVYSNSNLYLSAATDVDKDAELTSPAVLDRITLSGGLLTNTSARVQLAGFVGKNSIVKNGYIYTVSSSQGGLSVINQSTFKQEKFIPIDYSSALTSNANGSNIFVLKDRPGQIIAYNASNLSVANTISLNADLPQTQSSIEAIENNGSFSFLYAGGRSGLSLLTNAGQRLSNIEVPASLSGYDPEDLVTNNVSINNGLIYIANGAAGLYVAKLDGNNLVLLGKAFLGGSTNFVKSIGNLIFVATGNGGLKILKITAKITSSSTVPCGGRATLASDANGWRNLNSGTKEYFTGTTILGGLNVNDNSIFDFCGNFTLNYTSNINGNGAFLVNGNFQAKQQFNTNGYTEIFGSANFASTLTVNSNATLKLVPNATSGETYIIGGDFNINGNAEVNNSTLQLNQKLSINSSGKLKLVNTNLIVNGSFDFNGTIEFVGNCSVTIVGKYTRNSSAKIIGSNTGKQL